MSLVSSLSAALLAILIQRWARDYMHMFQRYSNPFEIARIRQYLHEGVERWRMSTMVEAVPALVHISLFLFFIGLADFLLTAYAIVGKITLFPIIFCVTVYIISTVAPIIDPQTPYRTSFSGLVWYSIRRLGSRPCNDRFGNPSKPVSSNMADGQMQLAMERNDARGDRDERAIGWLAENLRGDAEMESFTQGIPGSFNTEWGREVWNKHQECHNSPPPKPQLDQNKVVTWATSALHVLRRPLIRTPVNPGPPSPRQRPRVNPPARLDVDGLCKRIRHLLETYDNRDHFLDKEDWRKRSHACVETVASFAFCMNVDFRSFGGIGKLLSELGTAEKTNEWSETSLNRSFMMRWTCLSLAATRKMLNTGRMKQCAMANITLLALYDADENNSLDTDDLALSNAQKIDTQIMVAWNCVNELCSGRIHLRDANSAMSKVKKALSRYKDIQVDTDSTGLIDTGILALQSEIDRATHGLIRQLPGIALDTPQSPQPTPPSLADIFDFISNPFKPQLIYVRERLQGLYTLNQGQDIRDVVSTLVEGITASSQVLVSPQGLMERQLWRLQDLAVGGAFGFTLELYFLVLRQLLPAYASSSGAFFTTFYIGAFKDITSDWKQYKDSPGTQKIILNLICDICVPDRGIFSNYTYPDVITKELLGLLCQMIRGRESDYIQYAMEELRDVGFRLGNDAFRRRVYEAIAESLAAH